MAKDEDDVYDDDEEEICDNKPGYWEKFEFLIDPNFFIIKQPFIGPHNDEFLFIGDCGKDMRYKPEISRPPMKKLNKAEIQKRRKWDKENKKLAIERELSSRPNLKVANQEEEKEKPLATEQKADQLVRKEEARKPHVAKMAKQKDAPAEPMSRPTHAGAICLGSRRSGPRPLASHRPPLKFKCTNGHVLDFEIYGKCPHCKAPPVKLVPYDF